ncbi:hypothetical protein HYZ76_01340 [Candidatus Falkowbacteria bacterium]|nr:hypothetical protein [Candidatus Falkowbacteria bacterium]
MSNRVAKKNIIIIFALLAFLTPGLVLAQADEGLEGFLNRTGIAAGYNTEQANQETGLAQTAGAVTRIFLSLLGIIFISYTIYGGFLWMSAGGNEEHITKAKSIIKNGIIGLIVVLGAAAIYFFIFNALILTGTGTGGVPGTP